MTEPEPTPELVDPPARYQEPEVAPTQLDLGDVMADREAEQAEADRMATGVPSRFTAKLAPPNPLPNRLPPKPQPLTRAEVAARLGGSLPDAVPTQSASVPRRFQAKPTPERTEDLPLPLDSDPATQSTAPTPSPAPAPALTLAPLDSPSIQALAGTQVAVEAPTMATPSIEDMADIDEALDADVELDTTAELPDMDVEMEMETEVAMDMPEMSAPRHGDALDRGHGRHRRSSGR